MAVTVRFGGNFEATIDGYRWTSADERLERELNARLDPAGPAGSDPDPDLTAARAAALALGGEIVRADEDDGEYSADEVF